MTIHDDIHLGLLRCLILRLIAASYLGSSLLHIYVDRVGANSEGEGRGPSNIFGPGAYFERGGGGEPNFESAGPSFYRRQPEGNKHIGGGRELSNYYWGDQNLRGRRGRLIFRGRKHHLKGGAIISGRGKF